MIICFAKRAAAPMLAIWALVAAPAHAGDDVLGVDTDYIELKKIESGSQTIEADRGYIYFHGPTRLVAAFIKLPDEQDMEAFGQEWEEEFADAQEDYPRRHARWRKDVAVAEQIRKEIPPEPVKPTRENFSIGNILFRNVVTVGPQYKFASDLEGQEYSYLTAVEPGTYLFYGNMVIYAQAFGKCVCMGTVKFEVKPGVVTDIGNLPAITQDDSPLEFGLPSVLAQYPGEAADLRAYGKIDNNYGIRIGRLPALDGVMAYERDHMIDLKAEAEVGADMDEAASTVEAADLAEGAEPDDAAAPSDDMVETSVEEAGDTEAEEGQGE